MQLRAAEDAAEAYKSLGDWEYADREAAWKWMFEQGRIAEREACAVIAETPFSGEQDDITMEAKDRVAAAIRERSNVK